MTKTITCVICPSGCSVVVEGEGEKIACVSGNRCPRGREYAVNEFICPVRTLTSSVAVRHGRRPVVSVRTTGPVPKERIQECMGVITSLEVEAPIQMYQKIVHNISNTGVDLVATACIKKV
ncbi:MAG: DUF1667 domain-containing protein [Clostridium sp.]|nr:DUF1667 domain-containing protein [Clostridium sp.]